ncbi:MLP-like protein 28 [Senna tora]|uniref:MLP-like protein 28 n=1 Tax=Senna tora TaxID=362788 RepID=A0A834SSV3_9FABA|nr:MLP-like protein 28 [Senna tora]
MNGEWGGGLEEGQRREVMKLYCSYAVTSFNVITTAKPRDTALPEHSITFKVVEGDLLEDYKSFKFIIKLTPHLLEGSLVNWTLEYEKLKEDTPDPHSLLEKVLEVSKHIDASLANLI